MAHLGVLFLDELPEFKRSTLEALRQPLETGRVTIARANAHVTYPARIQLIAAMNPCRCGHLDDPGMACTRAPRCARDYQAKISGPFFDRIDLHVEAPAVPPADLAFGGGGAAAESSATVAARVLAARQIQSRRFAALGCGVRTNSEADGRMLDDIARPDTAAAALLAEAAEKMRLTARGYHRVLRVARTIADLDGAAMDGGGTVRRIHIAEAISFRRRLPGPGLMAGAA